MTVLMPTLSRAKNGDWFSRKVIPSDARDAYQRAFGVHREDRFRLTGSMTVGEAKAEFAAWVAEVEGRIASIRSAHSGEAQSLSHRQIYAMVGRWYDWFLAQHAAQPQSVEVWDHQFEQYQGVIEVIGGTNPADELEQLKRSPWYRPRVLAKVAELSRLPSFLALEGVKLDADSHERLQEAVEPDLIAAMALLRRQASGDFTPDSHRTKFPTEVIPNPTNAKLAGWNVWQAFEAWVKERKPAASTVNRWRGVFDHLNKHLDGRDVALVASALSFAASGFLFSGWLRPTHNGHPNDPIR
jgi:hypothetical protein